MKLDPILCIATGVYEAEFDADLIADRLTESDPTTEQIRDAITADAISAAEDQTTREFSVRGITADHIAAVRAALKERES